MVRNNLTPLLLTISPASQKGIDVVLIDTAGRMQDNEPLMKALSKVGLKLLIII